MGVLESHHFHHQMWCFAMNLFDRKVMRQIVLEEEEEEDNLLDQFNRQFESGTSGGGYDSGSVGDDDDYYEQ